MQFSYKTRNIMILLLLVVLVASVFVACGEDDKDNEHECESVCPQCGLCTSTCDEEVCESKCPGHKDPVVETHYCYSACDKCGLCTNLACTDPICANKCQGKHDPAMYVQVGNVRVGLLSDTLVRLEERGSKGFENRNTYLVSNRTDWQVPKYTETISNGEKIISTANYSVHLPQGGASLKGAYVVDSEGKLLWEYTTETTSNVYLPSPSDELQSWYFTDSPRVVPSDLGYGYDINNDDPLQGWDFGNDAIDCYVFLPQGDYKQFCDDYVNLTGSSEMVSLQMLGYWDSRWFAYDEESALQQIKDYTDRGYSLDVLVIDTDWHSSNGIGGVGYQINTELFPNMAKFLDECHDLGVNIMFNDHPQPVPGTNNVLDQEEVEFRNQKLTMILSLGLDYWWYDRNWSVALNPAQPDISVFAFGMYAFQFVTDEYLQSIADVGEYAKRALIMGNVDGCLHGKWMYASDISAHRYSIQWTGDINTDSNALAQEIYATIYGGAEVGLPYVSSDLGGHTSSVSDDMYVRWMQYGALSTICRVHCTSTNNIGQDGRMPWLFGDLAEDVVHQYVDMRYRLLPLYYSLARENYDTGLPIMRRTDIEYPQYNEASRNDQYLLGENILIAPFDSAEKTEIVPTSWLKDKNGKPGLSATYYSDTNFGIVMGEKTDSGIDFNWDNLAVYGKTDQYSVRWEGKITIGEKDSCLSFFADDGIRAYIDGQLVVNGWDVYDKLISTDYYKAGTTHDIKVEFREDYGGSHCYMYYSERNSDGSMIPNTRTVFIPDGTWMDVWTGERFTGPQTITVAHDLRTSPIFVREGAVLALAENMKNTSEKDWSNMTLDVYTGKTSTSTVLYEDDTVTQAYKYGHYRTTLITNEFANGTYTVTINPAEGTFTGDRSFEQRNWTVRIHVPQGVGALISLRVNGRTWQNFANYVQDTTSNPFALTGNSLDGEIIEFTLSDMDIRKAITISYSFKNEQTSPEAPEYENTPSNVEITVEDKVGDDVNLTDVGEMDWVHFGVEDVKTTVRKNVSTHFIGEIDTYSSVEMLASNVYARWTDGDSTRPSASVINGGLVSYKNFDITLKVDETERFYVMNLGGEQCIARLTIRDRAGNAQTVNFGNLDGAFAKRIVIKASSTQQTELQVVYSVLVSKPNGTGTFSRVNVGAMYVTSQVKDVVTVDTSRVSASIDSVKDAPATASLSESPINGLKVADWRHFGSTDKHATISMLGGNVIGRTNFNVGQLFTDYTTKISWNDGEELASDPGSTNGTCGDWVDLYFNVTSNTEKIVLYTGVWKGINHTTVRDIKGNTIASAEPFDAGETAARKVIVIDVNSQVDTTIVVRIAFEGAGGNVALAAIQVLEK